LINTASDSLNKLLRYCLDQGWEGYDPFDGLNSRLFQALPLFKNYKLFRMTFLQFNKKSPWNFRGILGIQRGKNPKGLGLFLLALLDLYKTYPRDDYLGLIEQFVHRLKEESSLGYSGYCWGNNFDWQSRAFFLPKRTPTVVNTSFIGRAFLRAYEVLGRKECLEIARSACDFILEDLNRKEDEKALCFSYSPLDKYFVHNATALASSLLVMTFEKTGEQRLVRMAKKSIEYVVAHQSVKGAWAYGEDAIAQKTGTDNFHTGFILESLKIYAESAHDDKYRENIQKGLAFYQENFFLRDGTPKYYYNKLFPIDIHSAAQAIVTLVQLKDYGANQSLCQRIVLWMIEYMQDKKGYFYYQKNKLFMNRIPYIRWSQAWVLHALAAYLLTHENKS
jgi:hypothetical protein